MKKQLFVSVLITMIGFNTYSQSELRDIMSDSGMIALAGYPKDVREHILRISVFPQGLPQMEQLQSRTRQQFRELLKPFDKEEQQVLWDITRYPGLTDDLAGGEKKKKKELKEIVRKYPEEIRNNAVRYGRSHYNVLHNISMLNKSSDAEFKNIIRDFPNATQTAYLSIVNYPEIISIMAGDIHTLTALGEHYRSNAMQTSSQFDSLYNVISEQKAKDIIEWKAGLGTAENAGEEFEQSGKEYAKDKGYQEHDLIIHDPMVVANYHCFPYSYWYGYPWWWDVPYWYPYPYWYDLGFFFTPYGVVYIGMPTWYFAHWYFFNHHHHYSYPHFTNYCVNYYYGPRHFNNGIKAGTGEWIRVNEPRLPRGFFNSDPSRVERIKQFGKFETDYRNSGRGQSKYDYLETHSDSYPAIKPVLKERSGDRINQPSNPPSDERVQPAPNPPVKIPDRNIQKAPDEKRITQPPRKPPR